MGDHSGVTMTDSFKDWTRHRLGRRGAFLFAWGALFILYGIGYSMRPLPERPIDAGVWHETIPLELRVTLWITTGIIATVSAFRRGPGQDTLGFIALGIMPTVRMASYGYAWALSLVTDYGFARGWVSAVFYAVMAATVLIVAGWHEHGGYAPKPEGDDA